MLHSKKDSTLDKKINVNDKVKIKGKSGKLIN